MMEKRFKKQTDRMEEVIKKQIAKFRRTGKLPRDYDVIPASRVARDYGLGFSVIGGRQGYKAPEDFQLEAVEPTSSTEALILKENRDDFEKSLSSQQKKVFNLVMIGGLPQKQAAQIMSVSEPRVAFLVGQIRKKAKKIIARG